MIEFDRAAYMRSVPEHLLKYYPTPEAKLAHLNELILEAFEYWKEPGADQARFILWARMNGATR